MQFVEHTYVCMHDRSNYKFLYECTYLRRNANSVRRCGYIQDNRCKRKGYLLYGNKESVFIKKYQFSPNILSI